MDRDTLLHLQHLSPHDHLMASSGFFSVVGDGAVHFLSSSGGGLTAPVSDNYGSVPDLMQLDGQLFGGSVNVGTVGDHQSWLWEGGSSEDPPPALMSSPYGEVDGSPPSREQGVGELVSEQQREDCNVSGTRKRRDRAKTIVSERKRRVGMKEKLYELRSLVPKITKMDKASIVADAVVYVKNLQSYARKLKEEVAALEALPKTSPRPEEPEHKRLAATGQDDARSARSGGHGARVTRVDAAWAGEGRFFVTVECERRNGAAAHLCAAVESLACFRVESSSLGRSVPDRVMSTLTLKASDEVRYATIVEATVKHWVMAALVEEGFRPEATTEIFRIHQMADRSIV